MKTLRMTALAVAAAAALAAVSPAAEAHGRWRGGVVFHFGYPWFWWPAVPVWYVPPPAYPPVVIERGAITYVERGDVADTDDVEAREPAHWWYWCEDAKKYYPYVKDCPGGWRRVPPQPTR